MLYNVFLFVCNLKYNNKVIRKKNAACCLLKLQGHKNNKQI